MPELTPEASRAQAREEVAAAADAVLIPLAMMALALLLGAARKKVTDAEQE